MKKAASALRTLVKHCVSHGYCEAQPALLKQISASGSFEAEKIVKSIQRLADDRFWDSLEGAPQANPRSSPSHLRPISSRPSEVRCRSRSKRSALMVG